MDVQDEGGEEDGDDSMVDTYFGTTFIVEDEDHTLANSLRFFLNKNPEVSFVGYAMPHPSEENVNIRVQTNGRETAAHTLRTACQDLQNVCGHLRTTFLAAVEQHKAEAAAAMEADAKTVAKK